MKNLRALVESVLSDDAMGDFLSRWDSNIGHSPHIRLPDSPYAQFAEIADDSRVRLATLHRLPLEPFGGNFEFKAVNKLWTVPSALLPALTQLHNARALPVAELSAALDSESSRADLKKSLAILARSGVILVERAPS
jgi:hypothetical protein